MIRAITRKQIMLALEGDPEATQAERNAIMAALDGRNANTLTDGEPFDRVLTRKQVAEVFAKSEKWVDWEAKREGTLLERVYLGGSRSAGFSAASVKAALASRKATDKSEEVAALAAATSLEAQAQAARIAKAAWAKAEATIAAKKAAEAARKSEEVAV